MRLYRRAVANNNVAVSAGILLALALLAILLPLLFFTLLLASYKDYYHYQSQKYCLKLNFHYYYLCKKQML